MKRYFSSRKAQGCSKLLSESVHGNENFMERKKKKEYLENAELPLCCWLQEGIS